MQHIGQWPKQRVANALHSYKEICRGGRFFRWRMYLHVFQVKYLPAGLEPTIRDGWCWLHVVGNKRNLRVANIDVVHRWAVSSMRQCPWYGLGVGLHPRLSIHLWGGTFV